MVAVAVEPADEASRDQRLHQDQVEQDKLAQGRVGRAVPVGAAAGAAVAVAVMGASSMRAL